MKKFVLLILLSLYGCATAKKIMVPSGNQGYLIKNCDIEQCYEKAAQTCPNGYKLYNADKSVGSVNGQIYTNSSLLIECKEKSLNKD